MDHLLDLHFDFSSWIPTAPLPLNQPARFSIAPVERMSSYKFDFHTVCVQCRGVDCDLNSRCIECTDVTTDRMSEYLAHKLSLKKKLISKRRLKTPSQSPVMDVAPAVSAVEPSPAEPVVAIAPAVDLVDPPVSVATVQESPSHSDRDIISHVESLFQSFSKSLEVRFSSIDERFRQVISSSSSNANDNRPVVSSQDVTNPSFTAPSPVAVRDEHLPARAPYAPYSDGLGKSYEGPAAVSSHVGVTSLPKLAFSVRIDRVRVYESSMGVVPDSFLDSLHLFVVYSDEFGVAIGGDLLADSVRSFHQHLSDLHDSIPGTSQGGDSIIRFLYRIVASLGSSPQLALGAAGGHRGEGFDSSEVDGIPASSLVSSLISAPSAFPAGSPFPAFPSLALSSSLPLFSSPAASSFPSSVAFSFPSGVFPSPTFSHPPPPTIPRAPAPHPLASSLPLRPPFTSSSTPSAPSSLSFPISSILSSAPSSISLGSFAPPLAPVSASSVALSRLICPSFLLPLCLLRSSLGLSLLFSLARPLLWPPCQLQLLLPLSLQLLLLRLFFRLVLLFLLCLLRFLLLESLGFLPLLWLFLRGLAFRLLGFRLLKFCEVQFRSQAPLVLIIMTHVIFMMLTTLRRRGRSSHLPWARATSHKLLTRW